MINHGRTHRPVDAFDTTGTRLRVASVISHSITVLLLHQPDNACLIFGRVRERFNLMRYRLAHNPFAGQTRTHDVHRTRGYNNIDLSPSISFFYFFKPVRTSSRRLPFPHPEGSPVHAQHHKRSVGEGEGNKSSRAY